MASSAQQTEPWWKALGFKNPPRLMFADGGEVIFRTWGGNSQTLARFFLRPKPRTRSEAERLCSVFEYGNTCAFVTSFRVNPGTPMHVGRVDQGEYCDPSWNDPTALQIFIANPVGAVVELGTEVLRNDLGPVTVSTTAGNA